MTTETSSPGFADQKTIKQQALSLLEHLIQTYPVAFRPFGERELKPLKLGIHKDLAPIVKDWGYDKAVLRRAMGLYTRQLCYQLALLKGEHRIDLEGKPAGEISDVHRQTAQEKVELIRAKRKQSEENRKPPHKHRGKHENKPAAAKSINEKAVKALQRKLTRKASV